MGTRTPTPGPLHSKALYGTFVLLFPEFKERITEYAPIDRFTIRFKIDKHMTVVFEYKNEKEWCLRTYKSYLNSGATIK